MTVELPRLGEVYDKTVGKAVRKIDPNPGPVRAALENEVLMVDRSGDIDLVANGNNIVYTGTQLAINFIPLSWLTKGMKGLRAGAKVVAVADKAQDASKGIEVVEQISKNADQAAEVAKSATARRVKPRKDTLEQVTRAQPTNAAGEMIDPNTKAVLEKGMTDLGHKPKQEWRRRRKMHDERGSSRREVIEAENDPALYQWEERSSNRSHRYED